MNLEDLEAALDVPRRNLRVLLDDLSECIDLYEDGDGRSLRYVLFEPSTVRPERVYEAAVQAVVRRRRGW